MSSIALVTDGSPYSRYDLTHLSDDDVLSSTRRIVGATNQLLADLLAHLAEVETRGIHRAKACSSLYTYCIYELRFSEDAAFRRSSAARWVKAFPTLFDAIASGELHLTGLLLLGPHLTSANCQEVLERAKHRTKKELAKLVRELDPLPDVPSRIAPLGPASQPRNHLRNPTWAEYTASMVPVRHLQEGERPSEWVDDETIARAFERSAAETSGASCPKPTFNDRSNPIYHPHSTDDEASAICPTRSSDDSIGAVAATAGETAFPIDAAAEASSSQAAHDSAPGLVTAPARVLGPQRYSVQFTAEQEYVDLVERARSLLSQTPGGASLEQVHLRAMRALVANLEQKKYGAPRREDPTGVDRASAVRSSGSLADHGEKSVASSVNAARDASADSSPQLEHDNAEDEPTERSRYVPARIRRHVFDRDGARCTFVDESGERCQEAHRLELHHLRPFGRDGRHHADNLTLRCQAHNAFAAEQDFGRALIAKKRDSALHESRRSQWRSETVPPR